MRTGTCENCQTDNVHLNRLDNEYGVSGVNFCVCDDCLETIKSDFDDSENNRVWELIEEVSEKGPWKVVRTRFHGGGIVLESDDISEIIQCIRRQQDTECTCGCVGVVESGKTLPGTEQNDRNGYSPYDLTE